ncbi:Vat family streptogramin A O-acetyltransferase [Treponema denticola]|uniref:Vat family streptogramin A O-acetyltransferase n=1 Tax=Treponema denticola TaxID=158 RepID=UPI0020A37668|nr:Vat family streptogramin A O-acetyltransferase [Treponema denticola]UTD05002.1 Vat family streptogramin A O-acetyltransferase [Treponema denticola]
MYGPQPNEIHPMKGFDQVCFIKNIITNQNIIVGDYSYYDDPVNSENFENNVLYHYPFIGDKLIIGKFCAIARDVKFIMNGANHKMNCFTTYPFSIFRNGWEKVTPEMEELPIKGDTVIQNDVWIGYNSLIMPGIKIGNGSIIASNSVVVKDVEPYSIVGGNPAKLIRKRFDNEIIDLLESIKWWDWPIEKITANLEILTSNDVSKLREISDMKIT